MSGILNTITGGLLGISINVPSALPSSAALAACAAIASGTQVLTEVWPTNEYTPQYTYAQNHYWSSANTDNVPACVVLPQNAQDVSEVVKILLAYPTVAFAVKSGGHNANFGFSSTGGVLISMTNNNSTTLSSNNQKATISPGATWAQAVSDLEPFGVTAVGGRVGDVGVGGLLLGCGLSFLSAQYGLPCDNVLDYEVVLSNSSIIHANSTSNSDLFGALKGGGNLFGIVTKFTVKVVPIGTVWGGYRTYSSSYASQLLAATQDFTENFPGPAAALFTTFEILADNLDQFITVFYFYNGPVVPPGVFDKFLPIPATSDMTTSQSYSSLLSQNAGIASQYGFRYSLRGATIPNLPSTNGTDLMMANYNNWISYVLSQGLLQQSTYIFTLIYQPMMISIPAASAVVNPLGNLLNLSTTYGDQMWMAGTVAWLESEMDTTAHSMLTDIMNDVASYARTKYPGAEASNFEAGGNIQHEYAPAIFMNDAMYDQQVFKGYGSDTYQRLKVVQRKYDPIGFFPGRTSGFNLTG
ncbi:FAD-binding domain-containing protein [Mollisia scopiformis]|uniref:FAD-binding domain-containing protein n=1 Tax=Mollisia scopiformis TaxID=149040 RepID=A0A132B7S5_MOLSC|nr:FAD-binding domain-containing protein [Mollisia scopiformis]KUJ08458.1 FAD-binding domain-containing protein [Mollisia scopiformis]